MQVLLTPDTFDQIELKSIWPNSCPNLREPSREEPPSHWASLPPGRR
jgi:hypothetical protein